MASTKRAANRAAMTAEIGRLGREHLSTHGAAQLSLRAIAREMGIASSAVYRYVPSRDDLLTLLLVEAYNDLAASVEKALGGGADPRADIGRGALAMRSWAVVDPARWALLYGSPVPGYAAPAGQTVGPGTRAVRAFLQTLDAAQRGGLLRADLPTPDDPLVPELVAVAADFEPGLGDAVDCVGQPMTQGGAVLKVLQCQLVRSGLFYLVLSPDYDDAHHDHFHLEARPWSQRPQVTDARQAIH